MSDFFDDTAFVRASDDAATEHRRYGSDEIETIPGAWMALTLLGVLALIGVFSLIAELVK